MLWYDWVYASSSPVLALHHMILARLMLLDPTSCQSNAIVDNKLRRLRICTSIDHLETAVKVLVRSHGPEHAMVNAATQSSMIRFVCNYR